jgi:hypothetical protein
MPIRGSTTTRSSCGQKHILPGKPVLPYSPPSPPINLPHIYASHLSVDSFCIVNSIQNLSYQMPEATKDLENRLEDAVEYCLSIILVLRLVPPGSVAARTSLAAFLTTVNTTLYLRSSPTLCILFQLSVARFSVSRSAEFMRRSIPPT